MYRGIKGEMLNVLKNGEFLSMDEISNQLGISNYTASSLLSLMCRQGLINRQFRGNIKFYKISEKGKSVVQG